MSGRMSFFRNFRTKARRAGDPKQVNTDTSPGSLCSNTAAHKTTKERSESMDSRTASVLNRSNTFVLNSDKEGMESKNNISNSSTLEKTSKKSKMLSKFSTFTKRKKAPRPTPRTTTTTMSTSTPTSTLEPTDSMEHHPSDNATNTYYKWKQDGKSSSNKLDYDSQSDPFNFLYEQHSTLKEMQQNSDSGSIYSSQSCNSSGHNLAVGSLTYRKGKLPTQLKEQLSQLKTQTKGDLHEDEELAAERQLEADKYKTVTINSFRKSFREKFLQNQSNVSHNPAWFVEVELPKADTRVRGESKENRPDFLVFDNENYRPHSRSPLRDTKESTPRTTALRSPVKRNETFRLEHSMLEARERGTERHKDMRAAEVPSISLEIKKSTTPNLAARVVPVGVAKPMLTQFNAQNSDDRTLVTSTSSFPTAMTQNNVNNISVGDRTSLYNWGKAVTVTPAHYTKTAKVGVPSTGGRYQTLVQIRNESNVKQEVTPSNPQQRSTQHRSHLSTHIQVGDTGVSPTMPKRLNAPGTRHSLAMPSQLKTLRSYDLLKSAPNKLSKMPLGNRQQAKHTYFGDALLQPDTTNKNTNNIGSSVSLGQAAVHSNNSSLCAVSRQSRGALRQQQPQAFRMASGGVSYMNRQQQQQQQQQQRQQSQPQQQQQLHVQRRSRSPIKIPWR